MNFFINKSQIHIALVTKICSSHEQKVPCIHTNVQGWKEQKYPLLNPASHPSATCCEGQRRRPHGSSICPTRASLGQHCSQSAMPHLAVSFHSISCPSTDSSSSSSVKSWGGAGLSSSSPKMNRMRSAAGETAEVKILWLKTGWYTQRKV